jgi:DNA repair protein RadC
MRYQAEEPRPAPVALGAGSAQYAPPQALAWHALYRRAPGNATLARDLVAQLDRDPVARSAHLALYVLSRQAMRRRAQRRARIRLILQSRMARAIGNAWRLLISHAVPKAAAATAPESICQAAASAATQTLAAPPLQDIEDMTEQEMQAEILMTHPGTPTTSRDPATRSAALDRRLAIARSLLLLRLERPLHVGPCISSPQALRDWLCLRYAGLDHEVLMVLFLDAQRRLIAAESMFRGTLTETAVYPREIVKAALLRNAAAVAMVHNHPSAALEPSQADQLLTRQVAAALELVQVKLVDHFVVAGTRMVSMAQRGLL